MYDPNSRSTAPKPAHNFYVNPPRPQPINPDNPRPPQSLAHDPNGFAFTPDQHQSYAPPRHNPPRPSNNFHQPHQFVPAPPPHPNAFAPHSPQRSAQIPQPPVPATAPPMAHLTSAGSRDPSNPPQSSFYNPPSSEYSNSFYNHSHAPAPQPASSFPNAHSLQQGPPSSPPQHSMQQSTQHPVHQSNQHANPSQDPMPFMMAGLQQMSNMATNNGLNHAALGAQLLHTFAPTAAGYTNQIFDQSQEKVKSFMRMPKYYFAVNHRYVLKKLSLILMPFMQRIWGRQRGMHPSNFDGISPDGSAVYLPPREDVNAPDLYIPVMSFLTYVLLVGIVFGMRNAFQADVLAKYFSKGLAMLTIEVLVIKLGLYLINARPTPWLDVIAYRGYKFVGVVLTILLGLAVPRLYYPALIYSATAMGIFLMRSHRRIILPRDMDMHESQDLARRNAFLLFVCVLQYPIYWILASVLVAKT